MKKDIEKCNNNRELTRPVECSTKVTLKIVLIQFYNSRIGHFLLLKLNLKIIEHISGLWFSSTLAKVDFLKMTLTDDFQTYPVK